MGNQKAPVHCRTCQICQTLQAPASLPFLLLGSGRFRIAALPGGAEHFTPETVFVRSSPFSSHLSN